MGYNTVAVIYNDFTGDKNRRLESMDEAVRDYSFEPGRRFTNNFGYGMVISQAHADFDQVVIVGKNTGYTIDNVNNLGAGAASQMIDCLIRNGYLSKEGKVNQRRTSPSFDSINALPRDTKRFKTLSSEDDGK